MYHLLKKKKNIIHNPISEGHLVHVKKECGISKNDDKIQWNLAFVGVSELDELGRKKKRSESIYWLTAVPKATKAFSLFTKHALRWLLRQQPQSVYNKLWKVLINILISSWYISVYFVSKVYRVYKVYCCEIEKAESSKMAGLVRPRWVIK